jgi:hypothetical protein
MSVDALTSPAKADLFESGLTLGMTARLPSAATPGPISQPIRFVSLTPTRYPNYTVVSQPDAAP